MTSYADIPAAPRSALARAEGWLDARGRMAWIALMVIGFVAFWPLGLLILGYMVVNRKFGTEGFSMKRSRFVARGTSGNSAFDAYRAETLRRLEDEQAAFEQFLKRLRDAKDKAEFDQFMADRARKSDDHGTRDA